MLSTDGKVREELARNGVLQASEVRMRHAHRAEPEVGRERNEILAYSQGPTNGSLILLDVAMHVKGQSYVNIQKHGKVIVAAPIFPFVCPQHTFIN